MLERSFTMGLVMAGLTGCSGADAPAEPTNACAAALTSAQGHNLNGMSAQGIQPQGLSAQGMQAQGINAQGMQAQGFSLQGLGVQGLNVQGMGFQGMNIQGMSFQGFSGQGVEAGVAAVGVTSLRGLALRNVSAAEAATWVADGSVMPAANLLVLDYEAGVLGASSLEGDRLTQSELTGVLLPFGTSEGAVLWITISDVSAHPDAEDLPLYSLSFDGENICGAGIGGLFVPGVWDDSGTRHDEAASGVTSIDTTFSCTTGVIAKCTAWGYRPWSQGAVIHEACTRMARADYCGDGVPHTENGTLIDMFDTRGIQSEVPDDGMSFEAGWGPAGAVCVREPRYIDRTPDGSIVHPSCWAELPRCDDFGAAVELGAELGNNSHHLARELGCVP